MPRKRKAPARPRIAAPKDEAIPPSPFAMLRRAELIGDADPKLAESPLDVLHARGHIDIDQTHAGHVYAYHHDILWGKGHANAARYEEFVSGWGEDSDRSIEEMVEAYDTAKANLLDAGQRSKVEVENVAVYRQFPRWIVNPTLLTSSRIEVFAKQALLRGLDSLVDIFCARREAAE